MNTIFMEDWKRELSWQSCAWCGGSLSDMIFDEEDIEDYIFNCESSHGPFCSECWDEFSEECPDCSDKPVTGMAAQRRAEY